MEKLKQMLGGRVVAKMRLAVRLGYREVTNIGVLFPILKSHFYVRCCHLYYALANFDILPLWIRVGTFCCARVGGKGRTYYRESICLAVKQRGARDEC